MDEPNEYGLGDILNDLLCYSFLTNAPLLGKKVVKYLFKVG